MNTHTAFGELSIYIEEVRIAETQKKDDVERLKFGGKIKKQKWDRKRKWDIYTNDTP